MDAQEMKAGKTEKTGVLDDAAAAAGKETFDLTASEWYLNRELTWLEFNRRVFHESTDARNPLLERIFFLAVIGSNLDEFFMKRIGGLKQQVGAGVKLRSLDGRTPQQQLNEIYAVIHDILTRQQATEHELLALLAGQDIHILPCSALNEQQRHRVTAYFRDNIYPLLIPQGMDPAHPFPFISNLSLNLLVGTRHGKGEHTYLNRIKVPTTGSGIPRFIQVEPDQFVFVLFEDVIADNLDIVFPGMKIESCELFRVTRNAVTEQWSDQAVDLLSMIETALQDRKFAEIVRIEVNSDMTLQHREMLACQLGVDAHKDIFTVSGIMAKRDLMEIAAIDKPELHFPPHQPLDHYKLTGDFPDIFHLIREEGPFLLQHPYESFSSTVERFLKEASTDPRVLVIKMTLYRTSADSQIIQYLLDAARNGKQVAVVVELLARFDESANIHWATHLEEAGIHVTYGVVGLKTHSKVIFVARRDYDGLKIYAHIGTGNYHADTARTYSDLGLLTCDRDIGDDLTEFFNFLTLGYAPARNYKKLFPSPRILKKVLLENIRQEIEHQVRGGQALIQLKSNALTDADIITALYQASQAGVRVDLIIRDSCLLRPGIPGLSENIRVVSIVGRFLEHARLYYFKNNGREQYFIGSADLMLRNLEHRVEVVAPVESPALQKQLREMLNLQLADRRGTWEMQLDGTYVQCQPEGKKGKRSSQELLIQKSEKRLAAVRRQQRKLYPKKMVRRKEE